MQSHAGRCAAQNGAQSVSKYKYLALYRGRVSNKYRNCEVPEGKDRHEIICNIRICIYC